jgi:hypothetical protein
MNLTYAAVVVFLIPIVAIIGGISIAIAATISKGKIRELEIRERIAMIEKGMVPPPEVDPAGFDRAMVRYERLGGPRRGLRRAGITIMGLGFGLAFLIAFAGDNIRAAIGVGGFLVILGLAFLVNSLFETQHDRHSPIPPIVRTPPQG